jgi:hypothetical protein
MSTIAERVAKGSAFLDGKQPGWDKRIDLERLDLESGCNCILGQLHPAPDDPEELPYIAALRALGLPHGVKDSEDVDLGFYFASDEDEFPALEAEWRRLIEARRAAS